MVIFYNIGTEILFWTTFVRRRYSENQTFSSYKPKCEDANSLICRLNIFADAIHWHLQNGMHKNVVYLHLIRFCDEQPQVAVRESALIVTSLECHKGIKSPLQNLQPQSEGKERQAFSKHWELIQPA